MDCVVVIQFLLFVPLLTFDERRIMQKRNFCLFCIIHENAIVGTKRQMDFVVRNTSIDLTLDQQGGTAPGTPRGSNPDFAGIEHETARTVQRVQSGSQTATAENSINRQSKHSAYGSNEIEIVNAPTDQDNQENQENQENQDTNNTHVETGDNSEMTSIKKSHPNQMTNASGTTIVTKELNETQQAKETEKEKDKETNKETDKDKDTTATESSKDNTNTTENNNNNDKNSKNNNNNSSNSNEMNSNTDIGNIALKTKNSSRGRLSQIGSLHTPTPSQGQSESTQTSRHACLSKLSLEYVLIRGLVPILTKRIYRWIIIALFLIIFIVSIISLRWLDTESDPSNLVPDDSFTLDFLDVVEDAFGEFTFFGPVDFIVLNRDFSEETTRDDVITMINTFENSFTSQYGAIVGDLTQWVEPFDSWLNNTHGISVNDIDSSAEYYDYLQQFANDTEYKEWDSVIVYDDSDEPTKIQATKV